jgi:hypothetical protein
VYWINPAQDADEHSNEHSWGSWVTVSFSRSAPIHAWPSDATPLETGMNKRSSWYIVTK